MTLAYDPSEGQEFQRWVPYAEGDVEPSRSPSWTRPHGVRRAALRGYSPSRWSGTSSTRSTWTVGLLVAFYVGDLDPEGEDIAAQPASTRPTAARLVPRVATPRRAAAPPRPAATRTGPRENPGKERSNRAPGFVARHGRLFQSRSRPSTRRAPPDTRRRRRDRPRATSTVTCTPKSSNGNGRTVLGCRVRRDVDRRRRRGVTIETCPGCAPVDTVRVSAPPGTASGTSA